MSRDRLARAVDQLDGLIAGVRPDQGGDPTPCAGWDVDTLVAHIVDQTWQFAGVEPSGPGFRAAADALLARERTDEWQVTQQTVELATHAWDLARATGQPTAALDPEIATVALAFARENVKPEYRGPTAYFGTRSRWPTTSRSPTGWPPSWAATPREPRDRLAPPGCSTTTRTAT